MAKRINDVSKDELLLMWKTVFEELCVNKTYTRVCCVISKVDRFHFSSIDLYKDSPGLPEVKFPADHKPFNLNWIRNFLGLQTLASSSI